MSISDLVNGENSEPTGNGPRPTTVLVVATAFGAVAACITDWETAATVFVAILYLFTTKRRE
jgi:hypothetical protein